MNTPNILVIGYPYTRSNFRAFLELDNIQFVLPKVWKIKGGKAEYRTRASSNIRTTTAPLYHSNYPIIGGLLKGWMPMFPLVLWRLKQQRNIDLVFEAHEPTLLSTLYHGLVVKFFGLKHVVFSWENIPFDKKYVGLKGAIHRIILSANLLLADGVVCGNKKCLEIFKKITNKPLALIPLAGLDSDNLKPATFSEHKKVRFVFAGAIDYRKGLHVLLPAFKKLLDKVPESELVLIGSGTYEKQIQDQISALKLSVTQLPWLNQTELIEEFSKADVFVYPSISHAGWEEQFGYSMAEASLMHLPVIATKSGSIEEVVVDGETGILVEEQNINALEEAMFKLAQDKALREKMGLAGRDYILRHFSNQVLADKFFSFFKEVLGSEVTKKSILYVTNVRLPTDKAHGLQIIKTCEAFVAQGATVELIVPKLKPTYPEDPFKHYGVKETFAIRKIFVLEVLSWERLLGRWVGYIQNISFSLAALFYLLLKIKNKENKVFYSRDYMTMLILCLFGYAPVVEIHDYRSKSYKKTINFILQHSKKIIVNSEGTYSALLAHYKIPDTKMLIAPNGVDLDFFDLKVTQEEARKKLGINSSGKIVAYVGRLETVGIEKGISVLLESFKKMLSAGNQASLYIVGGPDTLIKKYKVEARNLGIPDDLLVFTGQVNYLDISVYLKAFDVLVIPSPKNQHSLTTSPIKLFEYMAAGRAMVVSDLLVIRKYLNEKSAVFFEPGDSLDLANKMGELIGNDDLINSISGEVLKLASGHTWSARARDILNFI